MHAVEPYFGAENIGYHGQEKAANGWYLGCELCHCFRRTTPSPRQNEKHDLQKWQPKPDLIEEHKRNHTKYVRPWSHLNLGLNLKVVQSWDGMIGRVDDARIAPIHGHVYSECSEDKQIFWWIQLEHGYPYFLEVIMAEDQCSTAKCCDGE